VIGAGRLEFLLERFSNLLPRAYVLTVPSGYKVKVEGNVLEAFVTFYRSASKYSGPRTDGFITRDLIMTTTPP